MPEPITLHGPRVVLRPWREADHEPFAALNADAGAMRHFASPLSREASDALATRWAAHGAAAGWGIWVVEERGGAPFLGAVGLMPISWQARFTPATEISWRIAPDFQRRGFAEEAARLALRFGFDSLRLAEIVAFTIPANEASWRLMEKLGMRADGDFDHPRLPEGHAKRRHVLYRLCAPGASVVAAR